MKRERSWQRYSQQPSLKPVEFLVCLRVMFLFYWFIWVV